MNRKTINFIYIFLIIVVLFFLTSYIPIIDLDKYFYVNLLKMVQLKKIELFFDGSMRYVFVLFWGVYLLGVYFSKIMRKVLVFGFFVIYMLLAIIFLKFNYYDLILVKNIVFFVCSYFILLFYYYVQYESFFDRQLNTNNKLDLRLKEDFLFEDITVLFVDIQNYTGISEKLESSALIYKFLNKYISYIEKIIVKYDGILDKILGDGLMLIFRGEGKEQRAVKCALEVLSKRDEFIKNLQDGSILSIQKGLVGKENIDKGIISMVLSEMKFNFKIGISTGKVFLGKVGGKDIYATTVIGETVNIASRLEGLNKVYRTNLLVDENTVRGLSKNFFYRQVDVVKLRGKNELSRIYQPFKFTDQLVDSDAVIQNLELRNKILEKYFNKNFDEALSLVESYLKIVDNDKLAIIYYNRLHAIGQNMVKIQHNRDGVRTSGLICE